MKKETSINRVEDLDLLGFTFDEEHDPSVRIIKIMEKEEEIFPLIELSKAELIELWGFVKTEIEDYQYLMDKLFNLLKLKPTDDFEYSFESDPYEVDFMVAIGKTCVDLICVSAMNCDKCPFNSKLKKERGKERTAELLREGMKYEEE